MSIPLGNDQSIVSLPPIESEDIEYYIYDPQKQIFMPTARLTSEKIYLEEKPKQPECFNLLAREPLKSFFHGISSRCVSIFYWYYDNQIMEPTVRARVSGVAVSPTHVLTIAQFPDSLGAPSFAVVTSDNFAHWGGPYDRSVKGRVITPATYDRETPVLIELEEPFFESFLRPSFRPIPHQVNIYGVIYNGEVTPDVLKEQHQAQETKAQQPRDPNIPNFMYAVAPFAVNVPLAGSLLFPSHRTVSAGSVVGVSVSGNSVYVSFSISKGSSGGPVFFDPVPGFFDGIVFGASFGFNANSVIPSSSPKFQGYWAELEKHLPK